MCADAVSERPAFEGEVKAFGKYNAGSYHEEPHRHEREWHTAAIDQRCWQYERHIVREAAKRESKHQCKAVADMLANRTVAVVQQEIVRTRIPVSPE